MESRISSTDEVVLNYKDALTKFHSSLPKPKCLDVLLHTDDFFGDAEAIHNALKKSGLIFRLWHIHDGGRKLDLLYKNTSDLPTMTEPLHVIFLKQLNKEDSRKNIFAIDGDLPEFISSRKITVSGVLHKRVIQALNLSSAANCQIDVCYYYVRSIKPEDAVYFQRAEKSKIPDNHGYDSPYDPLVSDYYLLYHPRSFLNLETQPDWDKLFKLYQDKIGIEDKLITAPARPLPEIELLKQFCQFSVVQANKFIETYFNQWSESYLLAAKHKNDNPYAQLWYALITHDVRTIDWELIVNSLEMLNRDESHLLTPQELNYINRILMDMRTIIVDKKMPASYEPHYLNLRRADLKNANLAGADLSHIFFSFTDFEGANLEGAIFTSANFASAKFSKTKLSGAVFRNAHFRRTKFRNADLKHANFSSAYFYDGEFRDSLLEQSVFFQTTFELPSCEEANFTDAIFCEAIISGAKFHSCIFERTDFSGATITDSQFYSVKGKPRFLGFQAKDVEFLYTPHAEGFFPKDGRYQLTQTTSNLFSLTTKDKPPSLSLLDSIKKLF